MSGPRTDLQDAATIIEQPDDEGSRLPGQSAAQRQDRSASRSSCGCRDPDARLRWPRRSSPRRIAGARPPTWSASRRNRPASASSCWRRPASCRRSKRSSPRWTQQARPGRRASCRRSTLKNATATELLPAVQRIYAEQSQWQDDSSPRRIYTDASGTRLTVFGTKEQADARFSQIVETLESQGRAGRARPRCSSVGRLAEAQRVLPLAAAALPRSDRGSNPAARRPRTPR
ncbi:MAG: hypothetical protein MZV64_71060 [Ignavibacteriales bacterium]|nr:hypothetical protein [Ignavibacteriales bacterium]